MKKQLFHIAATLSLFLMLGAAAGAQTTREMTITIPFDFNVGETALSAGTYTVYRTSTSSGNGFMLRDAKGQPKVVFHTRQAQSAGAQGESKLEFRSYDDKYFLAYVWAAGNNIGHELQPSRQERELAQEAAISLAQKGGKPGVVTVTTH